MERHFKFRKWIIYAGVFFLALSTVVTIISSSSKFNAQVAEEVCIAETDVNGDGLIDKNDCPGSSGTGTIDPCPEPTPVTEIDNEVVTVVPIGCEEPPVCEDDPPFDPALTGHTEGAFVAQVAQSKTIEDRIRESVDDALRKYKDRFTATLTMLKYPSSWFGEQANLDRFTNTFSSEMTRILTDPTLPYHDRIKAATAAAPDAMVKSMLTFTYAIPEDKQRAVSPVPDPKSSKFNVKVTPHWEEWFIRGLLEVDFNFGLIHKVEHNNGSETWCEVRLGIVVGETGTKTNGLDVKIGWRSFMSGFTLVGKGLFTPNWRVGLQYEVRF